MTTPRNRSVCFAWRVAAILLSVAFARQWQPDLLAPSEQLEGWEELAQSIRIILATPVNSVPSDPTFGSRLWEVLDEPASVARPRIVLECSTALARWEPRIEFLGATLGAVTDDGAQTIEVRWRPRAGGEARTTAVQFA